MSRGLCSLHWQREQKSGQLSNFGRTRNLTNRTHKKCTICAAIKPLNEFHIVKPKRGGTFPQSRCKQCNQIYCKNWFAQNSHKLFMAGRKSHLKHQYGITVEQYEELMIIQKGRCAICQQLCPTGNSLSVDHHHDSGKVRGLLCRNCNSALGYSKENLAILQRMIDYLTAHTLALS